MQEKNQPPAPIKLTTPLTDRIIRSLKAGDMVSLSGIVYTARDAARPTGEMANRGEAMPFAFGTSGLLRGTSPAKPGRPIGSVGPTTGSRMDAYSPRLMEWG